MPEDPNRLFVIANGHKATWIRYRHEIMSVFNELAPELAAWREHRDASVTRLGDARNAQRREAKLARRQIQSASGENVVLPQASAPIRQDRAAKRAMAYAAKSAIDTEERRFTD